MNDEVKHFYLENKTPIEKIIAIGTSRHGLNAESIKEAAKQVYQSIQDGEEIPQIRVAWKVYSLAKQLKITADAKENDEIAKLNDEISKFKKELDATQELLEMTKGQRNLDKELHEIELNSLLDELTKLKQQILWYKQSWWKRIFRSPAHV